MNRRAEAASREIAQVEKNLSSREEALRSDTVKKGQSTKGGKAGKGGKGEGGWNGQAKRKHGGKWW